MKRNVGLLAGLAVVVMMLAGCTTFKADGLAFMPMPDDMQVVGNFEDTVMVHKFLGTSGGTNLFNLTSDATKGALTDLAWKNIRNMGGTGAVNVQVTYGSNVLHWFLNNLTGRIWAPAKITVSGTVVKERNQQMSRQQVEEAVQVALNSAVQE